ncbi:MAG TPA: amidohydrolase [Gammaproteobacteria bacterium]|nr:amidohydrolase [Gammaproteobacteria bacterium]
MKHDIIIRGGQIVDGTGADPVIGDVAITDGIITAVGNVEGDAKQEINAAGHAVTPGFVDIHTHLDAQIGWDPDMTPVSWHGVTTVLIGNCGMTFAPCKPEDRTLMAAMMETVEDIPRKAILDGLAWDWEHYGEYLNSIEKLGTAVNVAGLVGHAAVRYYVMGDRSFAEKATEEEKQQMADIVANAIDDGAFGFSTNRYEPHVAPDGRSIPGTFADVDELMKIAETAVNPRKGLMQAVGANFELLQAIGDTKDSRILFSYGTSPDEGAGNVAANNLDKLCEGRDITAISHVRGSGYMFGLQADLPVGGVTWRYVAKMSRADRLSAICDDETATKMVEEAKQPKSTGVPFEAVFFLGAGDRPDYAATKSIKVIADETGEHWSETFLRLSRETEGRGLFIFRMFSGSLTEQANLFKSENIYPGLGDAGAHVGQIMDAGWTSFMLSHWYRETGYYSLPQVIQKMSSGPAKVVGLTDRGTLQEGMRADINVINLQDVGEWQPELVHDFPHGAARYIQKAAGYKATIVNGQVSLVDGALTGNRNGQVLRSA